MTLGNLFSLLSAYFHLSVCLEKKRNRVCCCTGLIFVITAKIDLCLNWVLKLNLRGWKSDIWCCFPNVTFVRWSEFPWAPTGHLCMLRGVSPNCSRPVPCSRASAAQPSLWSPPDVRLDFQALKVCCCRTCQWLVTWWTIFKNLQSWFPPGSV